MIFTNKDLPPRREYDFYPTPLSFARTALDLLPLAFYPRSIIDPGAGTGIWGEAAKAKWPKSIINGYEIRQEDQPGEYNYWKTGDYLDIEITGGVSLVMGNPPYKFAEEFIRKSLDLLEDGGYLVFMLRLAILESKKRMQLWKDYPRKKVVVCANRPSFSGDGKTNATAFAFLYWEKGYIGPTYLTETYIEKEDQ